MALENDSEYFLELQTNTGWGQILSSFARWCGPKPDQSVLDIGCGPGMLPALFANAGANAFGIDHDFDMLTEPLHPWLLSGDAAYLPFPDNTFDLVTASNILYLSPDPLRLLHQMGRVVQPGGDICLLNPSERMNAGSALELADERDLKGLARDTLVNYGQRAENHYRWSTVELETMFAEIGLKLTNSTVRMGPGLVRYAQGTKP